VLSVDGDVSGQEQLPKGTTIPLTVSKGPHPRNVPQVIGLERSDAVATLREAGLDATVHEIRDANAELGVVLDAEPDEGAVVEKGTVITLTVATGRPLVEVPDVEGMEVDKASDALEEAGLVVGGVQGPANRDVIATDPEIGTEVEMGTEVTLITRRPPAEDDNKGPGND
jgi:serine/threonine-protein kinase